jgi:hypothetical protein
MFDPIDWYDELMCSGKWVVYQYWVALLPSSSSDTSAVVKALRYNG